MSSTVNNPVSINRGLDDKLGYTCAVGSNPAIKRKQRFLHTTTLRMMNRRHNAELKRDKKVYTLYNSIYSSPLLSARATFQHPQWMPQEWH